jgi:membrane protein DedA with SNARE-associated domain
VRKPLRFGVDLRTGEVLPDSTALWVYIGFFGTLLAAGLGAPIPEELPIVTAGALVGHAPTQDPPLQVVWWIMLPILICGVVIGDGFLYTIGRLWGHRLLDRRWVQRRVLPPEKRARIERNFHRYGVWILLGARMMPGIRGPIFLMAGMNRLPVAKFLLADGLYAIPGVSMIFFLSYFFTDQVVELVKRANQVRPFIVLAVLFGVAAYLVYYFLKHPVTEGDPKEVPIIGQQIASHIKSPEPLHAPKEPEKDKANDMKPAHQAEVAQDKTNPS